MYQYSPEHNAVFLTPKWSAQWRADFGGQINGGLSIVGTTLFVESFDRRLSAIEATTGKRIWSQPLSNVAMNTPVVSNGLVIAGGGTGDPIGRWLPGNPFFSMSRPEGDSIYAFDATSGSPSWRFATFGENMPTGVLVDGNPSLFVFSNGDEHAYALDLLDGRQIWKVKTFGADAMSSLTTRNGIVFGSTGYRDVDPITTKAYADRSQPELEAVGSTWAIRASDGSVVWSRPYGHGLGSPTLADGLVFVESHVLSRWDDNMQLRANEVAAMDAKTGESKWRYVSGSGTFVKISSGLEEAASTYVDGVLYQALPFPKQFAAFDGRTGRILWKISTHNQVKMGSVVTNGSVIFGDVDGYLYVVRASDGTIEQTLKFPSAFSCSPPVIVGNTFFVANGKSLYALKLDGLLRGKLNPDVVSRIEIGRREVSRARGRGES